jgi:hypothetical protein
MHRLVTSALATLTAGCMLLAGAGCSSDTASRLPESSESPSDSSPSKPAGTAEPDGDAEIGTSNQAQAYIEALTGFESMPLPASVEEEASSFFDTDPALREAARGYAMMSATSPSGEPAGVILVIDIEPSFAALPGVDQGFAQGIGESAGTEPVPVTIAGTDAYQIDSPDLSGIAWLDDNLFGLVVGDDLAVLTELARALIIANG